MREILFRGKRKDNGEWIEGFFFKRINPHTEDGLPIGYYISDLPPFGAEVTPETVGQYTGLTDKNGKKIFEGDYWLDADDDYLAYVVEFRDGQFGFVCYGQNGALMPYGWDDDAGRWGEIDFEPMTDFALDLIEIIGNIHDNPELLEVT